MLAATVVVILLQVAPAASPQPAPQPPPNTDIYLASIEPSTDGNIRVGAPTNVSNHPGYDNQPFFVDGGGSLLLTSMRDGRQTDIYQYDIASQSLKRLTNTDTSEYSPTPAPGGRVSVIRVESDGTQRLWAFPAGGGELSLVSKDTKPVGYHAWADDHTLVLFVLGEPATLQIADVTSGKADLFAQRPGRCIARTPEGKISFVQKGPAKEPWQIMELDVDARKATPISETLQGREDYAWLPDGRLLMASGSTIFIWGKDNRVKVWQEVADLSSAGIGNITRIAVSPDGKRLAFVADEHPAAARD
jgi:Tol biopolymer transport system component